MGSLQDQPVASRNGLLQNDQTARTRGPRFRHCIWIVGPATVHAGEVAVVDHMSTAEVSDAVMVNATDPSTGGLPVIGTWTVTDCCPGSTVTLGSMLAMVPALPLTGLRVRPMVTGAAAGYSSPIVAVWLTNS